MLTTNYPPSHSVFYSQSYDIILGKFKDERAGSPISEGVFLKDKM